MTDRGSGVACRRINHPVRPRGNQFLAQSFPAAGWPCGLNRACENPLTPIVLVLVLVLVLEIGREFEDEDE